MTKLFEEYEFIRKSKENPEILVGKSFYWNTNFFGEPIPFNTRSITRSIFTIISYDKRQSSFLYQYVHGAKLISENFAEEMVGKMALYKPEEEL